VVSGTFSQTQAWNVNGGVLAGTGTLASVNVHNGGTLAPGMPGAPGTSMTINGNLAFQSGALYMVQVNATSTTFANVTGTAALAGGVSAVITVSTLKNQYVILQSGGLGGSTFASLTTTGLPAGFAATLSYNANDVFLNFSTMMSQQTGLNQNQQNVANALANFFNNGGTLPPNFLQIFGLTGGALANALTQLDGEASTDAEKGAFALMTQFLGLMLDPFVDGRSGSLGAGASNFAPEREASFPPDIALAYRAVLKAPPKPTFDRRWTVWGAGFGGANNTNGNAAIGSNNVRASDFGFAVGADYHYSPDTVLGFALAGAGTNWGLAQGLGGGRSDAFMAGGYGITRLGPIYLAGDLAFANHWFTTSRTALGDQLTAGFNGQSYGARVEAGYRYAMPVNAAVVGVTPYAALQSQWFHTASFNETDLTGGGFGLAFTAMNANDTRSELGARFDDLTTLGGMPVQLRARLAWAHDWVTNPALGAVFQALPGAAFTVNGAAPSKDSALTTAGAQFYLTPQLSFLAKFEGEFASGSQTYAGTGTVRYQW
jgi:uncharacterized protein with beta-barrel porin domain